MGRSLIVFLIAVAGAASWMHVLSRAGGDVQACGAYGAYDFNTLEMDNHFVNYRLAIDLLAEGKVIDGLIESAGETVDLRYQGLESGIRAERAGGQAPSTAHRIPPTVYYATAWIEANWANASKAVAWGGVGPVLRSFDCGYGLGQITSGMGNTTGTPTAKQALIGTHFIFNMAEGMRIMADKWNQAPEFRPIAGTGDPTALEDWYYAIWSYNGFAFINHPFNPDRNPLRTGSADSPIYHCYDGSAPSYVPTEGSAAPMFAFSHYTYPEKVYGCMRHAPTSEGVKMWESVNFSMPDFERPEVAAAFDPEHFIACDGHLDGCPAMDFPTSFPDNPDTPENESVTTNQDPTPPSDAGLAGQFLGSPSLSFAGPTSAALEATASGVIENVTLSATNTGSFVAPFRIRSTAPWLIVRGPGDADDRTLDGAVAVGSSTTVVVKANPRLTKAGHVQELEVTLDPAKMAYGSEQTATVYFEPLYGGGSVFSMRVTGTNNYVAPTPTPTPIPTDVPRGDYKQFMPGIAAAP